MLKKISLNLTTVKDVIVRRNFELLQEFVNAVYQDLLAEEEVEEVEEEVAPTRTVVEIWEDRAGTSVGTSSTLMPFKTCIKSSHQAWNGTSFTAPRTDVYDIDWVFQFSGVADRPTGLIMVLGGVDHVHHVTRQPTAATTNAAYGDRHAYSFSTKIYMKRGEILKFYANSPVAAVTLMTSAGYNRLSIVGRDIVE